MQRGKLALHFGLRRLLGFTGYFLYSGKSLFLGDNGVREFTFFCTLKHNFLFIRF